MITIANPEDEREAATIEVKQVSKNTAEIEIKHYGQTARLHISISKGRKEGVFVCGYDNKGRIAATYMAVLTGVK